MWRHRDTVRAEGSTSGLRFTLPITLSVPAPAWYEAEVAGVIFMVYVRAPPSRPYPTFTLPRWAFPDLRAGDVVEAVLRQPPQINGRFPTDFDWLPFAPPRCFPTVDGADLVLHSRYEPPFRILRTPSDLDQHYRLLGYYQAEGSKAASGGDWSFASALCEPAAVAIANLRAWGLDRSRLYCEVLHGPDESPDAAVSYFAPLGLDVVAVRLRSGRGFHAVVIHVRSSILLREMTLAAISDIAVNGFSSPSAARAYALGWLDGDGGVTIESSIRLILAGLEDEHRVVKEAFRVGFGWEPRGVYINSKAGTHVRLRLGEVADLLLAGAFAYSMSRVRLLLAFDERTKRLREEVSCRQTFRLGGATGPALHHGLIKPAAVRGYTLTPLGQRVVAAHAELRDEIERVRAIAPQRGITRQKGIPYPRAPKK